EDRLHHALLADRLRQFVERRLVHPGPRLILAGADAVDRDRLQRVGRFRLVAAGEQRIEAAAESFGSNHRRVLKSYAAAAVAPPLAADCASIRRNISPASARYASAPLDCGSSFSTGTPCDGASASRML